MIENHQQLLILKYPADPWQILKELQTLYQCPRSNGERHGPLIGYPFRYGPRRKQYVGEIFLRPALLTPYTQILQYFAYQISRLLDFGDPAKCVFCGVTSSEIAWAQMLSLEVGGKLMYAEKNQAPVRAGVLRPKLVFGELQTQAGDQVWIAKVFCNDDFSAVEDLALLFDCFGADVKGIVCLVNSSGSYGNCFITQGQKKLPIVSLLKKPFRLYPQDDTFVAGDVGAHNVVWSPEKHWSVLMSAMAKSAYLAQ